MDDNAAATEFGSKSIGFVGSIAILLNNILGPGIANFSGLYQQAGWLYPTITVVLCVISSIASGEMLLAAMRALPGNSNFEKRVEFGTLCRAYFVPKASIFCQIVFQLAMFTVNISNIIQTAQVFDYFVDTMFGDSCAVEFYPKPFHTFCHTAPSDITPFGTGRVLLSIGMCVVAVLSIPLGYWNLDDNVCVQNAALVIILLSIGIWGVVFLSLGVDADRVPAVGTSIHNMGGTILFNFMFIATLPSWACEKQPEVSALRAICLTLFMAIIGYVLVGVLGGMAFEPFYKTDNTILSELDHIDRASHPLARMVSFITVEAYAVSANMASIPIFSIIMRYNLVESGIFGKVGASIVSVLVPFAIAIVLYTGEGFKDSVNFSGTFTSSIANLMVPSLFFIVAQRRSRSTRDEPLRSVCEAHGGASTDSSGRRTFCGLVSATRSLESQEGSQQWTVIAWTNLSFMVLLTIASIWDQFT